MFAFTDHRTLVYTEVSRQDYLVPKLGGTFNASEFEAHPERYRSVFADEVRLYSFHTATFYYFLLFNLSFLRMRSEAFPSNYFGGICLVLHS